MEQQYIDSITELLHSADKVNIDLAFQLMKGRGINPRSITLVKGIEDLNKWLLSIEHGIQGALQEVVTELLTLKTLNLSHRRLVEVPKQIGYLLSLEELCLANNHLPYVTYSIGNCQSLRQLNLSHNNLTRLPATISQLTALQVLNISNNSFQQFPQVVSELSSLTKLLFEFNGPYLDDKSLVCIGQLQLLEALSLQYNDLVELPNELGQLHNLRLLDVSFNHLDTLPKEIQQLPKLKWLSTRCNSQKIVPAHLKKASRVADANLFLLGW
jgi:Leucine-rich repeat (LRR) protein